MFLMFLTLVYFVGIWACVDVALATFGGTRSGRIVVYSLAIVSGAVIPWFVVRSSIEMVRGEF